MNIKDKKKLITKNLLLYGFLPMLLAIQYLEDRKQYRWCEVIIKTLHDFKEQLEIEIPDKHQEGVAQKMRIQFMSHYHLSGRLIFANTGHLTEKILQSIAESSVVKQNERPLKITIFNNPNRKK